MPPTGIYYKVKPGDTLSSIAKKHRIDNWRIIYDDEKKQKFRETRPDPNIIIPGDVIWIPGAEANKVKGNTGKTLDVIKKPALPAFILEIVDENGSPITINTKIIITYSEAEKKCHYNWKLDED